MGIKDYRWFWMFLISRFHWVRNLSIYACQKPDKKQESLKKNSCLESIEIDKIVDWLKKDGLYSGINLPTNLINEIHNYVDVASCYGNRKGIPPSHKNRLLLKIVFGINNYRTSNYRKM